MTCMYNTVFEFLDHRPMLLSTSGSDGAIEYLRRRKTAMIRISEKDHSYSFLYARTLQKVSHGIRFARG